jgi:hypothetical protein
MKAMDNVRNELFGELGRSGSIKELIELTKLSDDDLYRAIGIAAREALHTLMPGDTYMGSGNPGDYEGKSPFFYRHQVVDHSSPALYLDLTGDDIEAGRTVFGQLSGCLDRLLCETVTMSPLYGYKQEAVNLGRQCVEAIKRKYPLLDGGIVRAFVAIRTKELFNVCTMW